MTESMTVQEYKALAATIGKARGRAPGQTKGMNKTEARYESDILRPKKLAGEIKTWRYEVLSLRLADNTFYMPNFLVFDPDWMVEIHEVKGGFIREDSWIRIKVAATQYPMFLFVLAQQKSAKAEWIIREV